MKVAVVYNRDSQSVINLFGTPNREKIGLKLIRTIVEALRKGGHQAISFEGDKDLVHRLEEFMPKVVKGERPGLVLNLSYGIQGQARYTHVPSILEMVGVPYVGSGPLAHSIALDKVVTKMILVQNGLPTPEFAVLENPEFPAPEVPYPVIVKPKHEAVSFGIRVCHDEAELREAAGTIFDAFGQAVLVERFVEGREVNVGLLGNAPPLALPPVELEFGDTGSTVYSYEDKTGKSGRKIGLVCPAPLGEERTAEAQELARRAFRAIGCYDCARVDMRLDDEGRLWILEINSLPSLGPRGSYVRAAAELGLDFDALVNRFVDVAAARYFGTPAPPEVARASREPAAVAFEFLTQRRDRLERRVREWTARSSRTGDAVGIQSAVRALGRTLEEIGLALAAEEPDGRAARLWQTPAGMDGGTLLVANVDVPLEPAATTQAFRREPEWLVGEGSGNSRGALASLEYALRAVRSTRLLRKRRIGVLIYADEGADATASADRIREAMGRAGRVLVLRPSAGDGRAYTKRRGERRYQLVVEGTPRRPGRGSRRPDPLRWLAARVEALSTLGSRAERASASVTKLETETLPLHLPHRVRARLWLTYADPARADALLEEVRAVLGRGARWELELLSDRPPMAESRASRELAAELAKVAAEWEIPFGTDSSVWSSVAGLAPAGVPVVCGLGPVVRDPFAPGEAVQRISLIQRTLLLAQFLLATES